jgi:hypothetical protein
MVLNSDREKQLVKMSQVKEAIRFLLHFFQSEKKSTLDLDMVCHKMSENLKSVKLSELECRDLIKYMSSDDKSEQIFYSTNGGEKWLNVIKVRNLFYLKMDKSFLLNDLNSKCDAEIERIKTA